jgi:type II secretory pathway component GspD/PulD (secretin)
MQSGQTLLMGGLMKDANVVANDGVPVAGDVPVIGALFRNHSDNIQKSELVILLKATIVPGANIDDMDRKLYKEFGNDRHPAQL